MKIFKRQSVVFIMRIIFKKISLIILNLFFLFHCLEAKKTSSDFSSSKGLQGLTGLAVLGLSTSTSSNIPSIKFVAVGDNCFSSISYDGKTWETNSGTSTVFPGCSSNASVYGVAYGNGIWVAVGSVNGTSGCGIWVSSDAKTWTQKTCADGEVVPLKSIAFGSNGVTNRFYAVGNRKNGTSGSPAYFNGQTSSDNGVTWTGSGNSVTNVAAYDNPSIVTIVYNSSSNTFLAHDNSTVNSSINTTGINSPTGWSNFSAPNLNFNGTSGFKMLSLPSGTIIGYGDLSNMGATIRSTNAGSTWSSAVNNKFSLYIGSNYISTLVYGDKLIALGPNCLIDFSNDEAATNTWSSSSTSTEVVMTGCSSTTWTASAYNSEVKLYVLGANNGKIAYSSSGLRSDWTILNSGVTNPIQSMAAKQ